MNYLILPQVLELASSSRVFGLLIIAVMADTVFGVFRAIKERKFNSCVGIDGAIRKIAMILSIGFCFAVDVVVSINLIGFLPKELLNIMEENLHFNQIGLGDFFGLLFIAYETVSVLKNMTLCGLPLKKIFYYVRSFLKKYTDELPDEDELEDKEA